MANRLLAFAGLAYEVARRAVPDRRHRFAPKRYTQPQLLACVLLKEYLRLDYRTARETIELSGPLREALGLAAVPDHTTLWRFARDGATPAVVAAALAEAVRLLQESGPDPPGAGPPLVAIDSTGLYCGHASRYFEKRRAEGGASRASTHQARAYQKWAAALWTGPQLVVSQLAKPGPCGDYPDLPPLAEAAVAEAAVAEAAVAAVPGAVFLADAGYDCEGNHAYCYERLGTVALIPVKTRRYVAGPRRP